MLRSRLLGVSLAVVLVSFSARSGHAAALQHVVSIPGGFPQGPTAIAAPGDGSGRIFIAAQNGVVHVRLPGESATRPFLELGGLTQPDFELGLLGLVFHPRFIDNGYFFVYYTNGANNILARYRVSASDPNRADHASGQVLLTWRAWFDQATHRGGSLAFGPDGYLYISTGDSHLLASPQDLGVLNGKMLRIDVDAPGVPYAIPPDNPFVGTSGARPEIWATGLRNPWKTSFDRATGELFIADVGEDRFEEVNVVAPGMGGLNFGWPQMEGPLCYLPSTNCNPTGTFTLPAFGYDHGPNGGCSITGGHRYRGTALPDLVGAYVYADLCTGRLWAARYEADTWTSTTILQHSELISSLGEGDDGELYVAAYVGGIYQLVGAAVPRSLAVEDVSVDERAGLARVRVTLSGGALTPSDPPILIEVNTADDTAVAFQNYFPLPPNLPIFFMPGPGPHVVELPISILPQAADGPDRTFFVRLSNPQGAVIEDGEARVTILDSDPTPSASIEPCTANEGAPCVFNVRLTGPREVPTVLAFFTRPGSAEPWADYDSMPGSVTFAPGEVQRSFAVPTIDDVRFEGPETFTGEISAMGPDVIVAQPMAAGTILDDDPLPPPLIPPALLAPTGTIPTATPTFRWAQVPGGWYYRLTLRAPGTSFEREQTLDARLCESDCQYAFELGLPSRGYTWAVAAGNDFEGWGPVASGAFDVDLPPHKVMTVAGTDIHGYNGDGGWGFTTQLSSPAAVAADRDGNVFIAETGRVRRMAASDTTVTTVAGTGAAICEHPSAPSTQGAIGHVRALAFAPNGDLLFASGSACQTVRRLDLGTGATTIVAGTSGVSGGSGDGGPALAARLDEPSGLAVDAAGNVFIADTGNQRIRRVDAATGIITTIAGTGVFGGEGDGGPAMVAQLAYPRGLAVDRAGHLYVADAYNERVRRIDAATGVITTVAGNGTYGSDGDAGPATAASLARPSSVSIDAAGNLWITTDGRVRFVDMRRGTITTMMGGGIESLDGGDPRNAYLVFLSGVTTDAAGNIFTAEMARVRRADNHHPTVNAGPDQEVAEGAPVTLTVNASDDADGDALTDFEWRNAAGQLVGEGPIVAGLALPIGTHVFTAFVRDGHGGQGEDPVTVTVKRPPLPPTVDIVHPRGEHAIAGQPLRIEWTAMAESGLAGFDVLVLQHAGLGWVPVDDCTGLAGTARSCLWSNPHPVTTDGALRVVARDTRGLTAAAEAALVIEPPLGGGSGLFGEYFDNADLTKRKATRIDSVVDFDWGTGAPAPGLGPNTFSGRWTGAVRARYEETYTFYTVSDDGVRLWIDGRLVIDNWTRHVATENQASVFLGQGNHTIRLEFFDDQGAATIRLLWSSAREPKQVIPKTQLFPALLYEDFDDGAANGWNVVSGSFGLTSDGTYRSSSSSSLARSVVGSAAWANYTAVGKLKVASWSSSSSRTAGLIARYQDPDNYYLLVYEQGQLKIKAKQAGVLTTLAAKPFTLALGRWYTFASAADFEDLLLFVDGVQELSAADGALATGKVGALTVNGDVRFDEVLVLPH